MMTLAQYHLGIKLALVGLKTESAICMQVLSGFVLILIQLKVSTLEQ